jgi:hypothetical protein
MTSSYILQIMEEKKRCQNVNVGMIENVRTCDVDALEVKARLAGFA